VILLTLLLVLFLCAVVVARPADAFPGEAPAPESLTVIPVARTPPAPASALPARWPQALVPPAGGAGQHGGAGYAARHTPAAAPVISPPKVPSGPRRRPGSAPMLVLTGTQVLGGALVLAGLGLFFTALYLALR
jgi:hypothetical protein